MGRLAFEGFWGEGSSTVFQHARHTHRHLSWRESYQTELRIYDAVSLVIALAAAQALRFGWLQGLLQVDELPVPYWLVGVMLALVWWLRRRPARPKPAATATPPAAASAPNNGEPLPW